MKKIKKNQITSGGFFDSHCRYIKAKMMPCFRPHSSHNYCDDDSLQRAHRGEAPTGLKVKRQVLRSSLMENPVTELPSVTCHMVSHMLLATRHKWTHSALTPASMGDTCNLIYLPRRDGRLSWPRWLDYALAGSRTRDRLIESPTP